MSKSDKHRKRHPKHRHDFWQAWHDSHEHWEVEHPPGGHPASSHRRPAPPVANAWRQFFHDFTGAWPEQHWAFGGRRFRPWHQGVDNFNPFVASLLSKGGGLLPLLVLVLLEQQPRYGNELMELITERTSGQWLANPGAIYPLMNMLETQELVEGKWADPRKRTVRIYHLTPAGEQEMGRLKAIVRPKLAEAAEVLQQLTQDLNGGDDGAQPSDSDDVIYL